MNLISSASVILHFLLFRLPNAALITNNNKQMAQGVLKGYDQATNLILDECHERVYSTKVGRVAIGCSLQVCTWVGLL